MEHLKQIKAPYLGLALVHMWVYCSTHRPSVTDDVSTMSVMYLALSAFLLAVFIIFGRLTPRKLKERTKKATVRAVDVASAASMAVSAVLLTNAAGFSSVAVVVTASLLGGWGMGWLYMRWCQLYARLSIRVAAPLIFVTMALGSVGKTIIDVMPAIPAGILLAICPIASVILVRRSLELPCDEGQPARIYNNRTVTALLRLGIGVAVFSLTVGIVQSYLLDTLPSHTLVSTLGVHGMEVVIALAATAWVSLAGRGLDFSRTWRLILVLMATALIFEPIFGGDAKVLLLSMVRAAQTFLIVFIFLAIADVARHSTWHPFIVFAAGWFAYSLPFALGKVVGDAAFNANPNGTLMMGAILWVLVMVTLFVFDDSSTGNHLVFADLHEDVDGDSPTQRVELAQRELDEPPAERAIQGDPLRERCAKLAQAHGLTPRETEILELLARGRSKAVIAETFIISENTVRGHAKHIYTKLDIHNRQELLDALDACGD